MKAKDKRTHKSTVEPPRDWYDLERSHTRVLLGYLRCAYRCGGYYYPCDYGSGISISDLRDELSKREHIPNKPESKRICREAAKRKV